MSCGCGGAAVRRCGGAGCGWKCGCEIKVLDARVTSCVYYCWRGWGYARVRESEIAGVQSAGADLVCRVLALVLVLFWVCAGAGADARASAAGVECG
jgi:hypothetical protein